MRIAVLVDELPVSSAPNIVGEEVFQLRRLGTKCDLFIFKKRTDEVLPPHMLQADLVHLDKGLGSLAKIFGVRMPSFSFFSLYHIAYPHVLSNKVYRGLDQYDVLIAHHSAALMVSGLRLQRVKRVFYCWDPISYIFRSAYEGKWPRGRRELFSSLAAFVDRQLLSRSHLIILPSKFHLNRIIRLGTTRPIEIVYPGTEVAEKIPSERDNFVLTVARWEAGKNPFFLLDVVERVKMELETKIVMVGPWRPNSLLKKFLQKAKQKGILEKFKIIGPKFGPELNELYLRARCLLHPRVEAFGFTGLEAAAHGCPVIFPRGSGVTELFTHGVHGYFPNEGNADECAEYLRNLVHSERLAWRMGHEAWNVTKKHTWEEHAKKLYQILLANIH